MSNKRYPQELRDRAVRLVLETRDQYPSLNQAIHSIGAKLGIGPESLRNWATATLVSFIDEHRDRFGGVEPMCRVLSTHGCSIDPSTYHRAVKRAPSARAVRDAQLKALITRVHLENFGVYGVRKVWREINRGGESAARCTVARLMRELGLSGAVRGKKVRTTVPDPSAERAPDLVKRDFAATAPNRCWVADFTYVQAYRGTVYVAFVVDIFSRRVVGWSAAASKTTPLVLGALEMGLWQRDRAGQNRAGLIHHSDAGSQYTSFRLAAHLAGQNIAASIGTVGDALDNALMESTIGLYKTELIKQRGPWHTPTDVEMGTAEWVDWYNNRPLHGEIGHVPPVEYEAEFYLNQPKPQLEAQL